VPIIGPPFRFVADLGDLTKSVAVVVPGQSGQPTSPHYSDQIADWFKGGYHPMLYDRRDVEREQKAVLKLAPGGHTR
jgi:penicillin amidase